jgi:hypothetical protein
MRLKHLLLREVNRMNVSTVCPKLLRNIVDVLVLGYLHEKYLQ